METMMSEVVGYQQKAKWIKTPCDTNSCVEIGKLPHGDFAIRNSMFRANTVVITEDELKAFLIAVRNGAFDGFVEVIR